MITLRRAKDRGHVDIGWLKTAHTFSFSSYHDPKHMGFSVLRVINDDVVAADQGFDTHGHKDLEIVTYVLSGELSHKDSMGNASKILPGDVQRMSAGSGVQHSEFNSSKTTPVHLLQIWIHPAAKGGDPGYEQKNFSAQDKMNRLKLVASEDGAQGAVRIQQDAAIYAGLVAPGATVSAALQPTRNYWLHVARGQVRAGEHVLSGGDALALVGETALSIVGVEPSPDLAQAEVLLFDLP